MRFRYVYMGIGSILAIIILLATDPNSGIFSGLPFGATTLTSLIVMLNIVFYVGAAHLSRRALFDYIDAQKYFEKALQTPEGAGRAIQAIAIVFLGISVLIYAATR